MMKRLKKWCRLYILPICMVLGILRPMTAHAYEPADIESPVSLTIAPVYPCEGAWFYIYRIADVSADVKFTLADGFKDYRVSLEPQNQAGWRELTFTLDSYVKRDGQTPLASGTMGADGRLTFPGLEPGLYLAIGDRSTVDGTTYTPEPSLVMLPGIDGDTWIRDVTIAPKWSSTTEPSGSQVERKVLKVWRNDGGSLRRPEEVTVQLLRDDEVWDTVTLNGQNNWRYHWEELDDRYVWRVVEKEVPDNYTVTVVREGITFVITNTGNRSDRPGSPGNQGSPSSPGSPGSSAGGPGDPGSSSPAYNIPDMSVPMGYSINSNRDPDLWTIEDPEVPLSALPQTGQLWWPVPVLAVMGLLLIVMGVIRRGGVHSEE